MPNNRIFYPTQRAGVAPNGSTNYTTLRGVQTIGGSLNTELERIHEIGQLGIYATDEGIPAVELTMEKVLDGHPPIYTLVTQDGTSATLIGRANAQSSVAISLHNDTDDSASGTPKEEVQTSGLYVSNISYAVSNDGNATESITLVGSDRIWVNQVVNTAFATYLDSPFINNDDEPLSITGSGGVNRREDVLFNYRTGISETDGVDANGAVSGIGTILPLDIPGVSSSGTRDKDSAGNSIVHLSSFTASVDFNREDLFELGQRSEYHKSTTFPLEVTTEITVTAVSGDQVSQTKGGIISGLGCNVGTNLTDRTIRLHMCEGLQLDLGKKNQLTGLSITGGSTDGANVEVTYTYVNNNDFSLYHPQDPNIAVANFDPLSPAKF